MNDKYNEYHEKRKEMGYYFRGKFIDTFNTLEKTIENYLITYFNLPNIKIIPFANIILDRMTFESKKGAFNAIMNEKAKSKGFIKTNNNSYPHGKLFNDIQECQIERNAFAHYYLTVPYPPKDSIISLAEFRDSGALHSYSQKEYDNLISKMNRLTKEILALTFELPERFPI